MERATFPHLEQLPNVGPAIAAKLRLIDVCAPGYRFVAVVYVFAREEQS